MKTALTEMFGILHPIIHYVSFAELASAVSNAGGLRIITGLTQKRRTHRTLGAGASGFRNLLRARREWATQPPRRRAA